MHPGRNPITPLLLIGLLALFASGCGGAATGGDYGGEHPNYKRELAGAPAPLATLYKQSNELLDGGTDAFEERLAALRGYPVVANVWASWCGPCRFEFGMLQNLSAKYGKRVAFVGVNSEDSDKYAETFLEEAPVPYPSYTDPDRDVTESIGGRGLPKTAYYSRDGEPCFVKSGAYYDEETFEADLRNFALQENCESG